MNSIFQLSWCSALFFWILSMCLVARAGEPLTEEQVVDKKTVIRQYGPPSGSVILGDKEILTYPGGKIVLKEGKVVSIDFPESKPAIPTVPVKEIQFLQPLGGLFRLSYDPDVWVPQALTGAQSSALTAGLTHYSGDFYLYLNIGVSRVPKDYIAAGMLQRLQSMGQPVEVVKRDNRMITGGEVTYMHIRLGPPTLRSAQHHYIYSGPRGTAAVVVIGPENAINARIKDVMAALNGLEILTPPPAPSETPAVKPEASKIAF